MSLFLSLPVDSTRNHQAIAFQRYFISSICGKIQYFLRSMQSVHRAHPPGHLQVQWPEFTGFSSGWFTEMPPRARFLLPSSVPPGKGLGTRVTVSERDADDGSQLRHKGCSRACHFPHWIYWWGSVGGSNRVWVGEKGGVRIEVGTCNIKKGMGIPKVLFSAQIL